MAHGIKAAVRYGLLILTAMAAFDDGPGLVGYIGPARRLRKFRHLIMHRGFRSP